MAAQIHTVVEKGRAETVGLLIRPHRFTSDNSVNKLENQRQKVNVFLFQSSSVINYRISNLDKD
jgi:hypothetical protein